MLFFAYDGSIHGDWVSHYAIRLASNHDQKTLHLLHIRDEKITQRELEAKLERIESECQRAGVSLEVQVEPPRLSVAESLQSLLPANGTSYLVCGTRVRLRKKGILSGTVSERLLRAARCNVLAVRVVQPGMLGLPGKLLVPVSGHPGGFRSGLPFLHLFAPYISSLHVLFVRRVARWRFRLLAHEEATRLEGPGRAYCERVEREIGELGLGASITDASVVVSDDVPKEIVIFANRVKARLIYMGASQRNLTERFLYGNPIEQVLRDASCDVAIYRGVR